MEEIIYLLIGFILAFVPKWFDRKRKIKAHWQAISAEISRIEIKTNMFMKDRVKSPLYRLPVKCYETSFSMLLTEGVVEKSEVIALENFYDLVEDINRGLDQASESSADKEDEKLDADYNRNLIKANELVFGEEALIKKVKPIIEHKSKLSLLRY